MKPEPAAASFDNALSEESFPGERFYQVWGTDEELWLLGSLVPPPVAAPTAPAGPLNCGPDRFRADTLLRRRTTAGFELMPSPATTSLTAIHGTSGDNVWLVGLAGAVFQFDGAVWHEHDIRGAEGLAFSEEPCWELSLHSVFALSSTDVWVVGYINPHQLGGGLILHYDGVGWKRHLDDIPDSLFDVSATSPSDVWAVGSSGLLYHFDGSSWQRVNGATDQYLFSVHGVAADEVWAVGNGSVATRFDGSTWTLVTPNIGYSESHSLAGTPGQGIFALNVSSDAPDGSNWRQDVQRFDGSGWQQLSHTTERKDALEDLFMTPSGQLWGVGARVIRFR